MTDTAAPLETRLREMVERSWWRMDTVELQAAKELVLKAADALAAKDTLLAASESLKAGYIETCNSQAELIAAKDAVIERLTAERDGEREARHIAESALRFKDDAMQTLFDRLRRHGDNCEDLIP